MRRQLRATGGITNARQGYGIGSWVKERIRKIIPNELANIAVKAAPFVAMMPGYGPAAAGIMRGVGRFDQRGSMSDALKQGIGTYAAGKVFDKGMMKYGGRGAVDGKSVGYKNLGEAFTGVKDAGGKVLDKTLGTSSTAKEILKNQLIIGGGTALVSLISQGLIDEPEQEPGESVNDFMARRKESVSKQLKTYLGNTNKFRNMSDVELDALVAQNMTEYDKDFVSGSGGYNQGGRVGYQTGGISMTNTMAQNRAINNARRASNQSVMQQARQRLTSQGLNRNQPTGLDRINVTNMANRIQHENLNQATGGARGNAAIVTGPPTQDDISAAINANRGQTTYTPASYTPASNYFVRGTGIPRGPNGGYIIDGVEYFSEQEAIDAMGMDRYTQVMAKGGRVGYAIGSPEKQLEAGAPPIIYEGNMDPNAQNQQAGLPAVPGPMQMAEDGPEFDMRQQGGFQPLGRQEGKDDVPAMLAKNEFVMTADAVRAAGGGSIQKGAQRMYDTMKKLERRVS